MAPTGMVSSLKGTGYNQIQTPRLSPEQSNLFQQTLSGIAPGVTGGLGQLSQQASGGTPEYWQQLEAPAMRQFGQLQGNIASRFSGMGTGARRSSGFQNAQSGAATDFAERLQSQRMGLQQSAVQQLMGLFGNLMGTQQFETSFTPKQKPWWQELLMGAAPGVAQGAGQAGGLAALAKLGLLAV